MTAPAIDTTSLEHLDHEPMCTMGRHVGPPARADYWMNAHDCHERLACAPCEARHRREFAGLLGNSKKGTVLCAGCRVSFSSYKQFVTKVLPL